MNLLATFNIISWSCDEPEIYGFAHTGVRSMSLCSLTHLASVRQSVNSVQTSLQQRTTTWSVCVIPRMLPLWTNLMSCGDLPGLCGTQMIASWSTSYFSSRHRPRRPFDPTHGLGQYCFLRQTVIIGVVWIAFWRLADLYIISSPFVRCVDRIFSARRWCVPLPHDQSCF